jgi:hypothetical protein
MYWPILSKMLLGLQTLGNNLTINTTKMKAGEKQEHEWLELLAEKKQLVSHGYPRLWELRKLVAQMNIDLAIKELFKNGKEQDPIFKNKYRSYKSKYLKSLKDKKAEKIGEGKIKEMLAGSGCLIKITVEVPKTWKK